MTGRVPDFYLGTHMPHWMELTDVPLFVSASRLYRADRPEPKTLPRALGRWSMDSGGFWEITHRGGWAITPAEYVRRVRRARDEIGNMNWAAPMDWMCEPEATRKTGLSIYQHQVLTIDNFIELRSLAPEIHFIPVLQGLELQDYHRCAEMYFRRGIDLRDESVVGLGSVCRREATAEIEQIASALFLGRDVSLHGFGVKKQGLAKYGQYMRSADSLAWSYRGRKSGKCMHQGDIRTRSKGSDGNCLQFALEWRRQLMEKMT